MLSETILTIETKKKPFSPGGGGRFLIHPFFNYKNVAYSLCRLNGKKETRQPKRKTKQCLSFCATRHHHNLWRSYKVRKKHLEKEKWWKWFLEIFWEQKTSLVRNIRPWPPQSTFHYQTSSAPVNIILVGQIRTFFERIRCSFICEESYAWTRKLYTSDHLGCKLSYNWTHQQANALFQLFFRHCLLWK